MFHVEQVYTVYSQFGDIEMTYENVTYNLRMSRQMRNDFAMACAQVDLNGAQVMRSMIKDFIKGVECEKTTNEQEEEQQEFQQACGTAQEESSASDERRLSDLKDELHLKALGLGVRYAKYACISCGNDEEHRPESNICRKCWNEYMRKS